MLTGLLAKLTISQAEYNKIDIEKTPEDKVKYLLDLLPRKDQRTVDVFSQLLHKNQAWLREKLNTELENVTEGVYSVLQ